MNSSTITLFQRLALLVLGLFPVLLVAQTQTVGKGAYGTWPQNAGFAVFGNVNCINGNNYALLQADNCTTYLNAGSGRNIHFRVGNQERMIVRSNGRVGIGIVNPSDKLHIVDATNPALRLSGGGFTAQMAVATNPGFYSPTAQAGDLVLRSLNGNTQLYAINDDISMVTGAGGAASEKMVIQNNGNVGIGRTPTVRKLEVQGEVYFDDAINFGGGNLARIVPDGGGVSYNGRSFGGEYTLVRHNFLNTQLNVGYNPRTFVPGGYLMTVDGEILAEGITIQNSTSWPDYVFESDYELRDLEEVEAFVNTHKHLPEVPSAKDVEDGVSVGEMQKVLLKKVEELTLYTIQQEKSLAELKAENTELKARLSSIENK